MRINEEKESKEDAETRKKRLQEQRELIRKKKMSERQEELKNYVDIFINIAGS